MIAPDEMAVLARLAGLTIDPAYAEGVIRNLETLLAQGALLTEAPLAAEIEPAEAYRP